MGKLSKDRRDIYYRKAKENGYRARSSFKLIQINEKFEIFKLFDPYLYNKDKQELINIYNEHFCYNIVDLCAAPGSWTQVLKNICLYNYYQVLHFVNKNNGDSNEEKLKYLEHIEFIEKFSLYINFNDALERRINNLKKDESIKEPKIISVDLQEIGNMNYVNIIQGDITKMSTIDQILKCMNNKNEVDNPKTLKHDNIETSNNKIINKEITTSNFSYANAVVSDGAPDITGMNDIDEFIQSQLILSSLKVCCSILKIGGTFISKIFRGEHTGLLVLHLNKFFEKVYICKPQSSRNKSLEAFLVCLNFSLPLFNIVALSDHNKKKSIHNKNLTHEQLRKIHTQFITKKDYEKKINSSKNDKKKINKISTEIHDGEDNQRNKGKHNEQEKEEEYMDENENENEDENENESESEIEYDCEYDDVYNEEDESEENSEEENENKEYCNKHNATLDEISTNHEVSHVKDTKNNGKNGNTSRITKLTDKNTVNDIKNKNIDIFNFYCSDSDEEIKYFNSEEEEIVNYYIASENFKSSNLFSFVATQNYYDSDKSYLLPQNYIRHEPQLMPLKPPYLLSLQRKRQETKKL